MKRFGVKTAPEGCGDGRDGEGPCFACAVHAVRRGRWMLRQLLPLKYSTYYFTGGPLLSAESGHEGEVAELHPTYVNVAFWRMWFGRVFAHEHKRWLVGPERDQIHSTVMQAMGEASMCWEHVGRAGVFDSTRAAEIGDRLVAALCDGATTDA